MTSDPAGGGSGPPPAPRSGDVVPPLAAATLSVGRVEIRLGPVAGRADVLELATSVERIRSVQAVEVGEVLGAEGTLWVTLSRPTTLGSELRRVIGRRLQSCVKTPTGLAVALAPPAAGAWRRRAVVHDRPVPQPVMGGVDNVVLRTAYDASVRDPHADLVSEAMRAVTGISAVVFDTELRCRAAAGSIHELEDYRPSRMIGERLEDVIGPAVWEHLKDGYAAVLAGRTAKRVVSGVVDPERSYETTLVPVRRDGRVIGGLATTRDVTVETKDRADRDELQQAFEMTFALSPTAQALLSADGRWVRVNAALCTLLGRPADGLIGHELWGIAAGTARARVRQDFEACRDAREASFDLGVPVDLGGSPPPTVVLRISTARGANQQLRGFVVQAVADGARP